MKPGALNTTGSHLLFCMAFMLIGGIVMGVGAHMYSNGDNMVALSLFNAGAGVFSGAFATAARSMGSIDPTPPPPAPTIARATETITTATEPPAPPLPAEVKK